MEEPAFGKAVIFHFQLLALSVDLGKLSFGISLHKVKVRRPMDSDLYLIRGSGFHRR